MKKLNILSLFGGMDTGRVALEHLGYKIGKSYYSEIKPAAIKLTLYHNPDTICLGDITKWKEWEVDWKNIDIIFSGSPCQDLSIAGKRGGIKGSRSNLFFTFVEILEYIKKLNPNVKFLQENVGSAPKKDIGIMSAALGLYPVRINSNKVTAQDRDRYYWSNIRTKKVGFFYNETYIPQPKDLKIYYKDIITSGKVKRSKSHAIIERTIASCSYQNQRSDKAQKYFKEREAMAMLSPIYEENHIRLPNKIELCRLQGFDDYFTDILTHKEAGSLLGDGWTLPVIIHILKYL